MIQRYRLKPVRAVVFNALTHEQVAELCGDSFDPVNPDLGGLPGLETAFGLVQLSAGDYIVENLDGSLSVYNNRDFKELFDPVLEA